MKKLLFALSIAFLFVIGCNSGGDTSTSTEVGNEQLPPPGQEEAMPAQTENPPHGQPGHVHDEGDPADAGMQVPADAGADGMALNPPHGEPGHRCDIAVGAPLPAN